MEKDIAFNVIDTMIFIVRKNVNKFEDNFNEISEQLNYIQKKRLARIPEKYILKSLVEDDSVIIQSIEELSDNNLVKEIKDKIREFEKLNIL